MLHTIDPSKITWVRNEGGGKDGHNGAFFNLKNIPGAVALSDSMAAKLGVKYGDTFQGVDLKGNKRMLTYADRAPESDDRIDYYDPSGSEKGGEPVKFTSARKINPFQQMVAGS